ncbi:hypothetical protein [Geopseudomonas sagittaria]|nr:hypothetical protein [Pseudomonas sagittaria]
MSITGLPAAGALFHQPRIDTSHALSRFFLPQFKHLPQKDGAYT